ncbi:MAG: hypothetical protein ACWGNV_11525 [Bacteroidales bacterium]
MKNIKIISLTIVWLFTISQLSAQLVISNDPDINNRIYLRAGIEPATMLTLGYERKFDLSFLSRDLVTYAEYGVSVAKLKNAELKGGFILPVFERNAFKILNDFNLSAGNLSTKHFDSKKFAVADELAFGIYKQKWYVAATAEYEKIVINRIDHTDFYRETYFEDAVDGWYKGAGGMFQFGIETGRTFARRYDVHLEFKIPFTEQFNAYGGSPAHVNLGLGYRF